MDEHHEDAVMTTADPLRPCSTMASDVKWVLALVYTSLSVALVGRLALRRGSQS